MAFLLITLCILTTIFQHPVLCALPPDNTTFLLLNRDSNPNQTLSYNAAADSFPHNIFMRDVLQAGLQSNDFWFFDQARLGNNFDDLTGNIDDAERFVCIYGAERVVVRNISDGVVRLAATWFFEQQDDGTFFVKTFDGSFLGLDGEVPMLYPISLGGLGDGDGYGKARYAFWSVVPVSTVEGRADVVQWVTVTRTADAPTRFLSGEGQVTVTFTVTEMETETEATDSPNAEKWTRNWSLPTVTLHASTGSRTILSTQTIEITPSSTITISDTASPATVTKTLHITELIAFGANGKFSTVSSINTAAEEGQGKEAEDVDTVTEFLSDEVVAMTETAWIDGSTVAEVATTVIVPATTVFVSEEETPTISASASGRKASGGGRLEGEVSTVIARLLLICFSLGGAVVAFRWRMLED